MSSIFDEIRSYEFDRNKDEIFGIKSGIIWGHKEGVSFPIAYISKPKSVTKEQFLEILDRLEVRFK